MDPKVAPSLQGSQKELERALNQVCSRPMLPHSACANRETLDVTQDRLATNLAHRPALETLVAEGIVQGESHCAQMDRS